MPFPIVRHHYAAQVRMIEEADAEEVEHFALIPVGATPDSGDGFNHRILARQAALQAQPLIAIDAVQVVDNFEARFGRIAIHRGNRAQADEFLIVLEKSADTADLARRNLHRKLAALELASFAGSSIEFLPSTAPRAPSQTV